jgi:hypothetical protein
MTDSTLVEQETREPVLSPVDRISELLFGLFMALTFVGAVAVGEETVDVMFKAALGCNLAWGLVDAVMHLVRTVTERGRAITLVRGVREAADPATANRLIENSLESPVAGLVSIAEIDAIRGRIVALPSVPARPALCWNDVLAALGIFLIVVASTFPVVLPFLFIEDPKLANTVTRGVALTMLFLGGLALGRFAGYGSLRLGFMMAGLGTVLVMAVIALGG